MTIKNRKIKKIIKLIGLNLLFFLKAYSQGNPNNINGLYIPSASQSFKLTKASEKYDADYYTGRVNYSASLMNVNICGINIPLGVSYRGNGIKVQEVAGSTGLGCEV